jgi:predicted nuclease with TOPRIM domain
MNEGMENLQEIDDLENRVYGMTDVIHEIKRVADTLEEILRLVKKDQEESKKRWEESNLGE